MSITAGTPITAPEAPATVDASDNVLAALRARAERDPSSTAVLLVEEGSLREIPVAEMLARVRRLAAGLVAAGVGRGDRVALVSSTRLEWALLDYAVWHAGAVTVGIYETSSAEQIRWILRDSGAVLVVAEDGRLRDLVEGVRPDTPSLRGVVTIDDGGLEGLIGLGSAVEESEIDERAAATHHDDVATLVYTSGTTGRPKGVVLTHGNLIWTVRQVILAMPELADPSNRTLSFLPLAHILARAVQLTAFTTGVAVGFGGGIRTLVDDLPVVRPTWLTVVPRVLEQVHDGARQKAGDGITGRVFDEAEKVAKEVGRHRIAGTSPPIRLEVRRRIADALVHRHIREAMGGEARWVISGGAPLHPDLALFFTGVGITALEGYGLTESTGPATINRIGSVVPGTVGTPLPGVRARVTSAGEIQLSGPLMFRGYWQDDAATADAFDGEWYRTGDLGRIDDGGRLVVTGRIKDLIVTAGGKNVAPTPLETEITTHPLVSHAVVVGDRRPFVAALLTLDVQGLARWAAAHGRHVGVDGRLVEELVDDPLLHEELQRAIDAANAHVSRAESIRAFSILATEFTIPTGELTPSLKVKRGVVIEQHAEEIETIYSH